MTAPLLSMNPADPPPFYRLDANPFQELCRDLLERQEGIATCEIYGVLGQGQRGVDLKASSVSNDHMEVAQCKCWEEFPPSEIEKASDQFLKHIEFWRKKKVTRFILMVASPLDTIQQQETLDIQRSRFAAEGITYEPWSSRTLRTKLKDHRDIVFRYTRSTEWVEAICGPSIDSGQTSISISGQVSLIESIVVAQLPIYSAGLSKEIADRVERIRNSIAREEEEKHTKTSSVWKRAQPGLFWTIH